jgi:hypothetical protein
MKKNLWLLVLVLSSASLMADIGFSNLGGTPEANGGVNNYGTPFTVGPSAMDLTNITITVFNYSGTADTIGLLLYSDNAGNPGTLLDSLGSQSTAAAAASPFANVDVSYSLTPIPLDANTTYWLVDSGGDNENCPAIPGGGGTGLPGWSIGTTMADVGGTWYSIGDSYEMSLEVTSVPEPSEWALFGLSLAGFAWRWLQHQNRV